jgi:hypothetical protein
MTLVVLILSGLPEISRKYRARMYTLHGRTGVSSVEPSTTHPPTQRPTSSAAFATTAMFSSMSSMDRRRNNLTKCGQQIPRDFGKPRQSRRCRHTVQTQSHLGRISREKPWTVSETRALHVTAHAARQQGTFKKSHGRSTILAKLIFAMGDLEGPFRWHERSLEMWKKWAESQPPGRGPCPCITPQCLLALADYSRIMGRHDKAAELLNQGRDIFSKSLENVSPA